MCIKSSRSSIGVVVLLLQDGPLVLVVHGVATRFNPNYWPYK